VLEKKDMIFMFLAFYQNIDMFNYKEYILVKLRDSENNNHG